MDIEKLTDKELEFLLFRIRADIMIDTIPITRNDLTDIFTKKLSAKELLERMLFPIGKADWDQLLKSSIEEGKELTEISNKLKIEYKPKDRKLYCKLCGFEGLINEFENPENPEDEELKCPDCESLLIEGL